MKVKPLIPLFIQEQWLANRYEGSLLAYTLFIDLKGFTPLTETLMREGTAGAERLSVVLNEIFKPLVQVVYARGGFIPYFAGDALTAIFPAKADEQGAEALIQTAAMARTIFQQRENRFDKFTIGLKFGLSYGQVDWGVVGADHVTFYFRGAPVDSCAHCQALAENQDIVTDGALLARLPNNTLRLEPIGDDAYKIVGKIAIPAVPDAVVLEDPDRNVALRFLPESVVDYKQEGEFRPVVSIFLAFDGLHDHHDLNAFATIVMQQVVTFSGYLKEIDFSDKGGLITLFFGAPVAFENNVDRALEFLLSLKEELAHAPARHAWQFKAGVTVGTAYTGIVGGAERCQYACVGNRVNLAARLMSRADWGEVLADDEVHKTTTFRFLHTGNIKYKGILGNVPTFKLMGRNFNATPTYSEGMIAREAELNELKAFAQPLYKRQCAGVAYLFGEAGIGKSRLTFELRQAFLATGKVQWFTCQADQILHKPFNPFIYFLRNYFEQSSEETEAQNRANFEARFRLLLERFSAANPPNFEHTLRELERIRDVLAALLGLTHAHSLWEQLDAKGRYQNTIRSIINLFLVESTICPLVIEVEDVHWIDESSLELLQEFVRILPEYPILLFITSRYNDQGDKQYPLPQQMVKAVGLAWMEKNLSALPEADVLLFAQKRLGGEIAPAFHQLLLRTTNSNPFYLEQMLEYFQESHLLEQKEGLWTIKDESIKLSNSINAILTARIDRLSKQVRETVKAAAVIGREFEVPVLTEIMRHQAATSSTSLHSSAMLRDEIRTAEEVQIWMAMNELRYIFRHSLLREAVYNMQLVTRLKQLHRLIAEAIERLYARQLEDRYVDLAFHYEQAGVQEKTCEYLRKAADHARSNYQNQLALEYYEKLLYHLGSQPDNADEIRTHIKRGKLLRLIGNWQEGERAFNRALELAKESRDVLLIGESNLQLGHLQLLKGEYDEALHNLNMAAGLFESVDETLGFAKVNGHLGNLYLRRGDYPQAIAFFEKCIHSGYAADATTGSAQVVANLALTHMNLGQFDAGIAAVERQLPLHRSRNDKQGLAVLLVNLGIVQYEKGDYPAARQSYEEGLQLAEELGNKQLVAIAMGSLGLVIQQQGDYEQAMQLFRRDLEITEELGDKQGIAIALGLIGELLKLQGEFYPAIEYMQKNLMLCEELGYQKGIAKAVNTLGDIFFFTEDFDRSLHFYNRAIELTRKISHKSVLCSSLIEKGLVLVKQRKLEALDDLEMEALALATELGNPDLIFDARALSIRVLHLRGQSKEGLLQLDYLQREDLSEEQSAEANYLRYRMLPADTFARAKAIRQFEALYAAKPQYLFQLRLKRLRQIDS